MQPFDPNPAFAPATPAEVAETLERALLAGRNLRDRRASTAAAATAEKLAEHLTRHGYVVLRPADGWPVLPF